MSDTPKPYIGGQAVLEGVMMRSPCGLSVAVRRPDGSIALREGPLQSRFATSRVWKLPGLRGVAQLVEAFTIGYNALRFSAEQQLTAEEREKMPEAGGNVAMIVSTLAALGLFIALPQLMTAGLGKLSGISLDVQNPMFHIVTGGFKLMILVAYLFAISRIPQIQRVFQYHGAEHKTIFAYESGLPLTVENVRKQSTLHPRCGTTFLIVVVIVAIIAGSIATPLLLPNAKGLSGQILTLGLRISLLPLIAAVSYELQRLSARYCTRGALRVVLWPGFLFQKITTREPDDTQIEIAIAAMQTAVWREKAGASVPATDEPLLFPSFASFIDALPALRPAVASVASV